MLLRLINGQKEFNKTIVKDNLGDNLKKI